MRAHAPSAVATAVRDNRGNVRDASGSRRMRVLCLIPIYTHIRTVLCCIYAQLPSAACGALEKTSISWIFVGIIRRVSGKPADGDIYFSTGAKCEGQWREEAGKN